MASEHAATRIRTFGLWATLIAVLVAPIVIAATSPLQAWRDAAYITGAMAGVIGLSLLVVQPLLASGVIPGLHQRISVRIHQGVGGALILAVAVHIGGLYLSSPMDVIDALMLVSPTPFSVYGVVATVAVIATGITVALRRAMRLRPLYWRIAHNVLTLIIVIATVIHALMIDGAMGQWSKWLISGAAVALTAAVILRLRLSGGGVMK